MSHGFQSWLKRTIPWLLLSVRVLMVPVMLLWPRYFADRLVLWFYAVAFITDYLDGAVARYFGTATPALRKTDSAADTIFQLAVALLIVRHHPDVFRQSKTALAVFLISAVFWYAMDAIRWRRIAGFHAYSAKLFSVGLLIWMILFLSGVRVGGLLSIVLIWGALSNVEGIVISALLREDRCDVPTVFHA